MSNHDLLAREIQLQELVNRIAENSVLIKSILRYNEPKAFDDPLDIPDIRHVMSLIQSSTGKVVINANADLSIDWQNDTVSNEDNKTFADAVGNSIANIQGHYDAGGGVMTPYSPNYTYTLDNEGNINILTITEVFAGTLTII